MLEKIIEPRFNETDALGHISNTVFLSWCEHARVPLFKIFTPDLDTKKWEPIIARNEVDYLKEVSPTSYVLIKTYLSKIGNSSMTVEHELYQNEIKVAHCKTAMIHFDFTSRKAIPMEARQRNVLEQHHVTK